MIAALIVGLTLAGFPQRTPYVPKTYVVATTGDDANPGSAQSPFRTISKAAALANPSDTITIRGGTYSEAVKLSRSGNYFDRQIHIQAAEGERVVLDGTGLSTGAVFDTGGQDHLTIKGITVKNAPALGFEVVGSYRVRLEDCRVEGAARSGIHVDKSHDVTVSHCDVAGSCAKGGEESVSIKRSTDVIFEDSEVHDTGHEGIDVKEGSKHVVVRRNRVFNVERQGLYADAWDADTGFIRFENNVIHDCMVGLVACTETGGLLHDVAFVGNLVYDCKGPGMMVAKWGDQNRSHRIRNVSYINNTVVGCMGGGKAKDWGGGMLLENDQAEDITVINNILSGNGLAQLRVTLNLPPKTMVVRNNLIDGIGENITKGNLLAKVRFTDAPKKEFSLQPGSPGIDAGEEVPGLPPTDLATHPRVHDKKVDMGALESGG